MWGPWTGAFVERLKALGWIDGQTVSWSFDGRRDDPNFTLNLLKSLPRSIPT